MGIKITGLDELQRQLTELAHRAESLSGEHKVPISELLTSEFMLLHTDFESVEAMFEASGFNVNTQADFAAIPDEAWDAFIKSRTQFESWEDMLGKAGEEFISKRLMGEA